MRLYCPVCDKEYPLETESPYCPESTDKGLHPLIKREERGELERVFPTILTKRWNDGKISFSVFREFSASYQLAAEHGKASWWVERAVALSDACEQLTGRGLVRTPVIQADDLAKELDMPPATLFVKNESLQMMGSHKIRHFAGEIMHLETLREIAETPKKTLACFCNGTTAVCAASVAKAAGYDLYVFLSEKVDDSILALLTNLNASVVVAEDGTAEERYEAALKKFGWAPFSLYARDVWSATEGAETLQYEFLFHQYQEDAPLDAEIVQVGGGGFANAVAAANALFKRLSILRVLPRFYACQPAESYPLAQSYFKVLRELGRNSVITLPPELAMLLESEFDAKDLLENNLGQIKMTAGLLSEMYPKVAEGFDRMFAYIGENRNDYFTPTAQELKDFGNDAAYDGLEVVRNMMISGGLPVIADNAELEKANAAASKLTGAPMPLTGSAGLAGLKLLLKNKLVLPGERCGVVFTGAVYRTSDLPQIPEKVFVLTEKDDISKIKK